MKSTVEQLSPTRVRINVEVPFDELKPNFDRAYRKLAKQVRIPGFRPGKAPARVLENRLGRGVILDEVINDAIPAKYMEAVDSSEIRTLSKPEIEVTSLDDGQLLAFQADVDVRPQFDVPDFAGLAVSVEDLEVTEEEVDRQLEDLRARFGTLIAVDRPIADKDLVAVDLSATVDGQEVDNARVEDFSYQVGSGELIDGIDEALIGASQGEAKTFSSTLVAGKHVGQEAEITVVIKSVKERQLPEANDEFAQLEGQFDTLDELKNDLRARLLRFKQWQQGTQARDKVLEALVDATEVPLPDSIVETEAQARQRELVQALNHDEAAFAAWLAAQDQTAEGLKQELQEAAKDVVKTRLILDAVAETQEIQVTPEELSQHILFQARRLGIDPERYAQQVQQSGQLAAIYADARRSKALTAVVAKATVTDASGKTLDVAELTSQLQSPQPATG